MFDGLEGIDQLQTKRWKMFVWPSFVVSFWFHWCAFLIFSMINQPYFRRLKNWIAVINREGKHCSRMAEKKTPWWQGILDDGPSVQCQIKFCYIFPPIWLIHVSQYRTVFREYFKKLPCFGWHRRWFVVCCSLESTQGEFCTVLAHQWWYVDILWWRLLSGNL